MGAVRRDCQRPEPWTCGAASRRAAAAVSLAFMLPVRLRLTHRNGMKPGPSWRLQRWTPKLKATKNDIKETCRVEGGFLVQDRHGHHRGRDCAGNVDLENCDRWPCPDSYGVTPSSPQLQFVARPPLAQLDPDWLFTGGELFLLIVYGCPKTAAYPRWT